VTKKLHIGILRRFKDAVRLKCPAKWRTHSWFLVHDNAPAHRSVAVRMKRLAKWRTHSWFLVHDNAPAHRSVAVRMKRLAKWRTHSWFLVHDNARAHRSVLVKYFLAKYVVTTLELPHSLDLATAHFTCRLD